MKILYLFIYISLALTIILSCQEELEWNVDNAKSLLVVEGQITTELKNHQVKLSQTSGLYDRVDLLPVSGATIQITDGTNTYNLPETAARGVYETSLFSGIPGNNYTLIIDLANPLNDIHHYEATDKMGSPFDFDNAVAYVEENSFDIEEDSSFQMVAFLYGKQPEQDEKYYLGELFKNDSTITDTITKAILVNAKEWGTEDQDVVPLIFGDKPEKFIHDILDFRLQTISKVYYDFIREIEISDTEPDPLGLSGPLANVKGNISNNGLGFFSAVAIETGQFYVYKDEELE